MNSKAKLRKLADRAWFNKYVKEECEVCGKKGTLQGHHFYYKGSYGHLRYDEDNCITLCVGCHFVLHSRDPKRIEQQIIAKRGKEWADNLEEKSKEQHKSYQTISFYKEVIEKLQ